MLVLESGQDDLHSIAEYHDALGEIGLFEGFPTCCSPIPHDEEFNSQGDEGDYYSFFA